MGSQTDDLLAVYLADHHAGATVGVELCRRAAGTNEGTELGEVLRRLSVEIEADRDQLQAVMEAVGASPDRLKDGAGWVGEKLGRFKLNAQLTGTSPLSVFEELEGLSLGIEGKRLLWRSLARVADPRLAAWNFEALEERAADQREELESHRLRTAAEAMAPRP